MIDSKQNREVIIVTCDTPGCGSVLRLHASGLATTLHNAIVYRGWTVEQSTIEWEDIHTCRACIREEKTEPFKSYMKRAGESMPDDPIIKRVNKVLEDE